MFSKGSKFYSIFKFKCPHCHEGEFFVDRNPYHLSTIGDHLEKCPVCLRRYEPEPGFYYGAMYVSYAYGVMLFVSVYVAMYVLAPDASIGWYIGAILAALFIFSPFLYALSKTTYANLFFHYKGVELTAQEKEYQEARRKRSDPK